MNEQIRSYNDLLKHQEQLEELLHAQKELVIYDFKQLKEEFKPATNALNLMGKFVSKDKSNNPILSAAANRAVDFVLQHIVLRRAGWLARLAVPAMLKNYSSHYFSSHKDNIKSKLFSWINHKPRSNGKAAPVAQPDAE